MAPRGHFGQGQFTTYNGDGNNDNTQPPPAPMTMPFGYFSTAGPSSDNQQHDMNQGSVLDLTDAAMMDSFFQHPDQIQLGEFMNPPTQSNALGQQNNFNFGLDSKVQASGDSSGSGSSSGGKADRVAQGGANALANVNVSNPAAMIQGGEYQTHMPNQQPHMPFGFVGYQGPQVASPNDDAYAGAHNLMNFSTQGQGQDSNMSSWGGINMGGVAQPTSPESTTSKHSIGSPNGNFMPLPVDSLYYSMYHQQPPRNADPTRNRPMNINSHARFQPDWMRPHGLSAQTYGLDSNKPGHLGFGTDHSFGRRQFDGAQYAVQGEKDHNLMGVPMADKAAHMPFGLRHLSQPTNQQRTRHVNDPQSAASSPGSLQFHGLPFHRYPGTNNQQQQLAGQNFLGHDNHLQNYEGQSRKRRKSTRDIMEENLTDREGQGSAPRRGPKVPKAEVMIADEYEPYAPLGESSSSKRRCSTVGDAEQRSASTSPSEDASPGPSGKRKSRDSKSRANLTEDQKRQNHILSEQKRRNLIRNSFNELNELVPCLKGGKSGLSKADIILEIVKHLDSLVSGNEMHANALGVDASDLAQATAEDAVSAE
ncbi:hypothetical protein KC332_g5192 [Hortaea werneckii]|nr:hypothetical protein KC329_g1930 [Hortaea werneckii]KAI7412537.1 hypothetical protein KC332_g5192 [Hortaea werneckii]KAI7448731.1 hypothetical protein KC336_g664 [Hortaea werneckii]KAI7454677.1 hypothetical protein KC368_g1462 [Hortaea werneckii]